VPTIAIVTVVLNDLKGLERTYRSIAEQSSGDFDWIVIDGKSTDGSVEFLSAHESAIYRWVSESDDGIYDAMNKGVRLAHSEHILFMNAGDELNDSRVIEFLGRTVLNLECDIDVLLGGTQQVFKSASMYRPPKPLKFITKGLPAFHQSTLYRTQGLLRRPYRTDYVLLADYEWLANSFIKGVDLAVVDRELSRFYVGGSSYRHLTRKSRELYSINRHVLKLSIIRASLNYISSLVKSIIGLAIATLPTGVLATRTFGHTSVPSEKVVVVRHKYKTDI